MCKLDLAVLAAGILALGITVSAEAHFAKPIALSPTYPRSERLHAFRICSGAAASNHVDVRSFKLDDCEAYLLRYHAESGVWEDSELPEDAPR